MKKELMTLFLITILSFVSFTIVSAEEITQEDLENAPGVGIFQRLRLALTFNKEKRIERALGLAEGYAARIEEASQSNPKRSEAMQKRYERYLEIAKNTYERIEEINETRATPEERERILRMENRFERHEQLIDARYDRIVQRLEENEVSEEHLERFEEFRIRAHEKNEIIRQKQERLQDEIERRRKEALENRENREDQREDETRCVPATCCHPTECVLVSEAPDCSDTFCTEECKEGTMDCGQGRCVFIDGNCEVEWETMEETVRKTIENISREIERVEESARRISNY